MSQSEVARLRQQIALEYEAAQRGLYGFAEGTSQHAFITARLENIAACHDALKVLVGELEAIKIVAETVEQTG
jgi:hypothetical protein